ncbi:hypothetical protein MSG28_000890 [Choristoneura fumiferana]|uniref:Uncharacterized protein n=1 Tax=Choristoneura fumiferana TaxID=7141 RepID=A0ACC0K2S2_CHOFU|nr:hypothetical protein MSG28_000890 [Choristoneura fumiferana]
MKRLREVDWTTVRRDGHNIFTKLIRTRDPRDHEATQEIAVPGKQRLSRCLTTMDLTSLGVGSCVGTGMYLVCGMVSRKFAGPGVVISFIIAALASIFSAEDKNNSDFYLHRHFLLSPPKIIHRGLDSSFSVLSDQMNREGACYAEFGVRVPNTTGSAYTYSYVTVGEFIAFVIGWNMVLEYLVSIKIIS